MRGKRGREMELVEDSLERIETELRMRGTLRLLLLTGRKAQAFADRSEGAGAKLVEVAPSLRALRGTGKERLERPGVRPQDLTVLLVADMEHESFGELASFSEWIDRVVQLEIRVVLLGAKAIEDFAAIQELLRSNVVDWLPTDLQAEEVVRRLQSSWSRPPLVYALRAAPDASVDHVLSHRLTDKDCFEGETLSSLTYQEEFRRLAIGSGGSLDVSARTRRLLLELASSNAFRETGWAEALGVPELCEALGSENAGELSLPREILLKAWCILLATNLESFAGQNDADVAELERIQAVLASARSVFLGENGDGRESKSGN